MDYRTIGNILLFFLILAFVIIVICLGCTDNAEPLNKELTTYLQKLELHPDIKYEIPYKIYYINLDRSTDRRAFMEDQFEKYNATYQRVSAIDGNTLDMSKYKHKNLHKYELACSLSHYKAIKMAYDEGNEHALIMEDDCHFGVVKLWKESMTDMLKDAPKDWEIIQLFTTYVNSRKYSFTSLCSGAICYLINRKGMGKIISRFTQYEIDGADVFIYQAAKSYTLFPSLFITSDFLHQSTIHKEHHNIHIKAILKNLKSMIQ